MASSLSRGGASVVSAEVALGPTGDGEGAGPVVVGSFTVDGLTFAVSDGGAMLVAVASDVSVASDPESASDLADQGAAQPVSSFPTKTVALPSSVVYDDAEYPVVAVGPYAFYLSGVTSVDLPDSVGSVDDRTFRSCDVARVEVDPGNPDYASYDGALYSADLSRILLVPEGRSGQLRIPSQAQQLAPEAFSHCASVDSFSVDADCPAFSSGDGLLYDAAGQTLLRVPAGAISITVREGCTTIAAGALEGCAKLTAINAPAGVASISPDAFASVPTVSLPAAALAEGEATTPQLTAMVALSSKDDALPEVDPQAIMVSLPEDADASVWQAAGFSFAEEEAQAVAVPEESESLESAAAPVASGLATASINEAPALEGFDWVQRYTMTGGVGIMLTDPVNGFWQATLSLNQGASSVTIDVRGFNGKTLGDASTKLTFTVSGFDVARARRELESYWKNYTGSYGYLNSLLAGSYGTGKPSYGNTWLGLATFTQGSFTFSCCGTDFINRSGSTPTLVNNSSVECFFRTKPYAGSMSTAFNHSFYPAPGTINGSSAAVSVSCANNSLALAASPTPPRGYTFRGWYTGPKGGSQVTSGMQEPIYWAYFAQYEPIQYPVAFDLARYPSGHAAGSIDAPATLTVESGGASGRWAIPTPKREGMSFLGWECDQEGLLVQDGTAWYVDCSKLPDAMGTPTFTARWAYVVSVDTPAAVTFGEYDMATGNVTVDQGPNPGSLDDGWDVDAKQGAPVSFKSSSLCDVGIEGVSSESRDGISLIRAKDGASHDAEVRAADLITMKVGGEDAGSRNTLSFALDAQKGKDDLAPLTSFVIPAEGELAASFRLNLEECGAYVSADAAGPEPESAELARLSYAYRAIPYGIGAVDASGSCTEDMYIPYDAANPFGLADIKAAANDIAARGAASEYWWLYKHLMYRDERDKTNAKLKVGGAYHDVQILGLRQDRLTTPTEGREFAGLSFGFRDIYEGRSVNASDTNVGGWEATSLREYLRTTFYASLPDGVATVIEPVVKQQQLAGGGIQRTDGETVFIPSTFEVCGDTGNSGYLDETLENSFRYQLFDQFESEQPVANAIKAKDGTVMRWWLRSAHRNVANRFLCMEETGMRGYNLPHYGRGVVPCFCL